MKIIVDAMGGDNAPEQIVLGALQAAKELQVEIILVGKGEDILSAMAKNGIPDLPRGVEISHASEVVEMCDDPATAFRRKKDSSLTVGLNLLKDGVGDAFISAGNTGALLAASTLLVRRIRGIRRAAMAPEIPTAKGSALLIDCGANSDCKPEFLLQFAYMGSYYAEQVLHRPEPRVGLLNIGVETSKGCDLQRSAYELLRQAGEAGRINFVGNVEAKEAILGAVDVIVTDGFTGNIMLKSMEGMGQFLSGRIKEMFMKSTKTKLAAGLVKDGIKDLKRSVDSRETGGTALLGISKPVLKAHGSSDAYAIKNAIRQAQTIVSSGIVDEIRENVDRMRVDAGAGEAEE